MNKKNVLIIGYGSIGRRHAEILKKNKIIDKIYIFTSQNCNTYEKISNLSEIKKLDLSLIIICSRTIDHFKHLKYITDNVKNKTILVEKPLFNKIKKINLKNKNKIFTGYNLRLHPVIQFTKKYLKNKKVFFAGIYCHSYLPNWRENQRYHKSNTAIKKYGGGVLLELSHEIDYLQWLFNKIIKINSVSTNRISNLKIDVEDYAVITGETKKINFLLDLNFFSKIYQRCVIIYGYDFTMKCDLIKNKIFIIKKNKKKIINFKTFQNYTYDLEHKLILSNNTNSLCDLSQGLQIVKIIDKIRKFK